MLEIREDQFYDSIADLTTTYALLLNVTTIWNVNHKSFTWSPGGIDGRKRDTVQ